jgi:hypothetical protein
MCAVISRVRQLASSTRALSLIALIGVVAVGVIAIADGTFTGGHNSGLEPLSGSSQQACAATVMTTLGDVDARIYREGLHSERTIIAERTIRASAALSKAIESGIPAAVKAAAQAVVATGRMTNLTILQGGRVLANIGSPDAMAPLQGTLIGADHRPRARFLTSVWSDQGFIAETNGVAESRTVVRSGERTVLGALTLPVETLPDEGSLIRPAVSYRYTSFPVEAYPSGQARVYIFRPLSEIRSLCGRSQQDTLVNTLRQVASLIYYGEVGPRALHEIRRVQADREMLAAVAARSPSATERAIKRVLNQHIVRLRVSAAGRLLSDVGGPFVLGPRTASLALHGRTIGSIVLSIQDDSGYLKLTDRLAGLHVLMYMGRRLVMGSIDPVPASYPSEGLISDAGHEYRVFTLHLRSFPGGPLRVAVFVPIPYA